MHKVPAGSSLAKTAYEHIYRAIISLDYPPGEALEEKKLMEELKLGRTPIREALLRLAAEHLATAIPGKGFVVKQLTLQSTRAVFTALKILELGLAEIAVQQRTDQHLELLRQTNLQVKEAVKRQDVLSLVEANHDFHMAYAACTDNEYLTRALHEIRAEGNRLAYLSYRNRIDPLTTLAHHYDSVVSQHDLIIETLENRNLPQLQQVIQEHIYIFRRRIIAYMTAE
jgi:DNA-binding GntR family transcriptional regulator